MLHSAVAVFTTQMPVQFHHLRVAVTKPLQQFGILGPVTIRLTTEKMPKPVDGSVNKASLDAAEARSTHL